MKKFQNELNRKMSYHFMMAKLINKLCELFLRIAKGCTGIAEKLYDQSDYHIYAVKEFSWAMEQQERPRLES